MMTEHFRQTDLWLRRMAIVGPIIAFIVGWGSGILTAAVLYRDHEKRISQLESCQREQAQLNMHREATLADIKARLGIR